MSEESARANATLGPCPLGFLLHKVNGRYSCRCDDTLPDSQVLKCIEDNEKVIIAVSGVLPNLVGDQLDGFRT